MRRIKTGHTFCAHHGVNRGHNSAECNVISREFDQYYDIIHEFLQTRGLGPYATGPGGRGHKSSRPHTSYGRSRSRGWGFGEVPPGNFPPDLPPDLPRGQFHDGPRHDFSAGYPYGNVNRGYSGGGQQRGTGHHHGRTRTDMGSRDTRGALARALTATLEAGTVSAILPTTGVIFDNSGRPPAIIIIIVFPRLGPTLFTCGSTGTDTISL